MSATVNRYLLDTNILTDLIKNPGGRVKERIAIVGEANICTSIIVALQTIEVLPLDGDVDRAYAEVRALLESADRPSGANDLLIAAHAVNEDCILVTNNEPCTRPMCRTSSRKTWSTT